MFGLEAFPKSFPWRFTFHRQLQVSVDPETLGFQTVGFPRRYPSNINSETQWTMQLTYLFRPRSQNPMEFRHVSTLIHQFSTLTRWGLENDPALQRGVLKTQGSVGQWRRVFKQLKLDQSHGGLSYVKAICGRSVVWSIHGWWWIYPWNSWWIHDDEMPFFSEIGFWSCYGSHGELKDFGAAFLKALQLLFRREMNIQ